MTFVVGTIRMVARYAGFHSAYIVLLLLAVVALCGAILAQLDSNASLIWIYFLAIIGYVPYLLTYPCVVNFQIAMFGQGVGGLIPCYSGVVNL